MCMPVLWRVLLKVESMLVVEFLNAYSIALKRSSQYEQRGERPVRRGEDVFVLIFIVRRLPEESIWHGLCKRWILPLTARCA